MAAAASTTPISTAPAMPSFTMTLDHLARIRVDQDNCCERVYGTLNEAGGSLEHQCRLIVKIINCSEDFFKSQENLSSIQGVPYVKERFAAYISINWLDMTQQNYFENKDSINVNSLTVQMNYVKTET
jgi:hypothetical protein